MLVVFVSFFAFSESPSNAAGNDDSNETSLFGTSSAQSPYANEDDELLIAAATLRRELPDNLYWKAVAQPRDDSEKKSQRELREHWATLYGRIYSGRATRGELDEYYQAQLRLQTDQLEILQHIENHHYDSLTPEKRRLLQAGREEFQRRLARVDAEYQNKQKQFQN